MKIAEKFESHSFPIERSMALFRFRYAWACVVVDGNIGRGRCPESIVRIIELSGRGTMGPVVVGLEIFKIMVFWPLI